MPLIEKQLSAIKNGLGRLKPSDLTHPEFKKSAVLILLIPERSDLYVIMTSRSNKLKKHRGEMSFPGGKFEPDVDKNLEETALRETREEIGLKEDDIEIIGRLEDFPTITGYIIRPFVGYMEKDGKKISYNLNHGEVAALVKIPLSFLQEEKLFQERVFPHANVDFSVLSFVFHDDYHDEDFTIWGASAHLLAEFLTQIFGKDPRSTNYKRPTIPQILEFRKNRQKKRSSRRKKSRLRKL